MLAPNGKKDDSPNFVTLTKNTSPAISASSNAAEDGAAIYQEEVKSSGTDAIESPGRPLRPNG